MSLSHKLIKYNQINLMTGSFRIPLSPIKLETGGERKSAIERETEEKVCQTAALLEDLIAQSKKQAEDIMLQAWEQAESIQIKAKEEGFQAGLQAGKQIGYQTSYDEGIQNTKEMKEQAKALLDAAHRKSREYIGRTGSEIIHLAAAMAKNVIRMQIDTKDESIVEMVKGALRRSEEKKQILLRSPAEFISILQANSYQFEKICPNANFIFLEDPTIQSPGCVIETEDQIINLEVDKQLDNIIEALLRMEEP